MSFNTYLCIFAILELVLAVSNPQTVYFQSDDIVKSFKSVLSSDYITLLANEFAAKAAEHFIKEMKTTEKKTDSDHNTRLRWGDMHHGNAKEGIPQPDETKDVQIDTIQLKSEEVQEDLSKIHTKSHGLDNKFPEVVSTDTEKPPILNEEEVMTLLDDPSPDGDSLGEQLSDAEGESGSKTIPVIGQVKINGAYYRRLLGMI